MLIGWTAQLLAAGVHNTGSHDAGRHDITQTKIRHAYTQPAPLDGTVATVAACVLVTTARLPACRQCGACACALAACRCAPCAR